MLAANLETLIAAAPENCRATGTFARYVGVGNGTIARLRKRDAQAKISTIERIAAKFGLEAWQLLVPGFSLQHRPRLASQHDLAVQEKFDRFMRELRTESPPIPKEDVHITKRIAHKRKRK